MPMIIAEARSIEPHSRRRVGLAALVAASLCAASPCPPAAAAEGDASFLAGIHHQTTLTSTVPGNGDQNPYAIVVAPVSAGRIRAGDVLVDNFNDKANLQGGGTTIVDYDPVARTMTELATVPRHLDGCPGGVGLTTAMTMLTSGWIIVGSLPSTDGTTATKGRGCLIVLGPDGRTAGTITDAAIDGPWGNMAVIDRGGTATLFVSNTGFGVGAPTDESPIINKANVVRLDLTIPQGQMPVLKAATVIADGFGEQADKGVFIIGPTGLALGAGDKDLYVSDALSNAVTAIPDAATRTDSAGTGRVVTKDGMLQRPLALAAAPGGHLLVTNGLNGQVVEVDPVSGKQLGAYWADTDKAQQPPGNGDLFGIAMTPKGDGFYYVEDDVNTLVQAH